MNLLTSSHSLFQTWCNSPCCIKPISAPRVCVKPRERYLNPKGPDTWQFVQALLKCLSELHDSCHKILSIESNKANNSHSSRDSGISYKSPLSRIMHWLPKSSISWPAGNEALQSGIDQSVTALHWDNEVPICGEIFPDLPSTWSPNTVDYENSFLVDMGVSLI